MGVSFRAEDPVGMVRERLTWAHRQVDARATDRPTGRPAGRGEADVTFRVPVCHDRISAFLAAS